MAAQTNSDEARGAGQKPELLTPGEREVIRLLGQAYLTWLAEGTNGRDLAEFAAVIHQAQQTVMAQAAARAYPTLYRLARGTS